MLKKICCALLLMCSMDSTAWWDTGHSMICDEAYKLLSPAALQEVDPLIEEHGSFGRACLWADWIKGERKETRSSHYINLPDTEQNTYMAKCPQNGCIIESFYNQLKVLNNQSSSFRTRQEALWFVGHFVGDIHQPMHVGYPEDLGGNRHQLKFSNGKKTNMHKVWDGQIIEHMETLHGKDYLLKQVEIAIKNFSNVDHSDEIESWAQESRNLAMDDSVGYRSNVLKIVTNEYMESHFESVQKRIALAAIRLGQTINKVFEEEN
jgi:hypothetical protein